MPIALTSGGESVCIEALVADTPRLTRVRRGLELSEAARRRRERLG